MNRIWMLVIVVLATLPMNGFEAYADTDTDKHKLATSVDELRSAVGSWNATTKFLNPDGSVSREVEGEYVFEWVVEDRVVSGYSSIPELNQKSGVLFYINEKKGIIEMAAVGEDGHLWIMSGPLGGATRMSQEFESADGTISQLRFTRFNVSPDRFESRMEYTSDGGATWTKGNHQVLVRITPR